MLLLMRRVGEVIRINKQILIEIKQAKDDEVTFAIYNPEDEDVKDRLPKEENKEM